MKPKLHTVAAIIWTLLSSLLSQVASTDKSNISSWHLMSHAVLVLYRILRKLCNTCPGVGVISYIQANTHTHTHSDQRLGEKGGVECAQRPYSLVTSLLFRRTGEKPSGAVFPVQLTPSMSRWCAQMYVCVVGSNFPWTWASPLPHTHFLLGDRQPLLSVRVSSAADPWGLVLGGNLVLSLHRHLLPADEKENKTWAGHLS